MRAYLVLWLVIGILLAVSGFLFGYNVKTSQQPQANIASLSKWQKALLADQIASSSANIAPAVIVSPIPKPSDTLPVPKVNLKLKTFKYKILNNVDACQLTKLGRLGWSIAQTGVTLDQVGLDTDCKVLLPSSVMDWVIMVQSSPSLNLGF